MDNEILKQQSKLLEEIENGKKTIEELKAFILSICEALSLRNPKLSELTLTEFNRIIGENNSKEEKDTETKGSSEAGQDSL
tara:strand:+ start:7519 stop:7761 length:243 start_codon:yes stop_codon:yes gene_type:complete